MLGYPRAGWVSFTDILLYVSGDVEGVLLRSLTARELLRKDRASADERFCVKGKWFAAAKDAGFFELAIELANRSPSDPRTLVRESRDFAVDRPEFALAAGMTALRGIAKGWGYDITGIAVLDAYAAVMAAAGAGGVNAEVVKANVGALVAAARCGGEFIGRVLGRQLSE